MIGVAETVPMEERAAASWNRLRSRIAKESATIIEETVGRCMICALPLVFEAGNELEEGLGDKGKTRDWRETAKSE
jgi:hypothetical protein